MALLTQTKTQRLKGMSKHLELNFPKRTAFAFSVAQQAPRMGTQTLPNRCEFPTLRTCSQKVFVNASSAARNVPGGGACNRGIQKLDPCPHLRCSFFARVTAEVYLRRSAFPTAFSTCHARWWTRAYCLRLARQPAKVSVRVRKLPAEGRRNQA